MVFFDLALGVDASQKALRLVAALHSEGVEVGPPTPLPPVQWSAGTILTSHPQPGPWKLRSSVSETARSQVGSWVDSHLQSSEQKGYGHKNSAFIGGNC